MSRSSRFRPLVILLSTATSGKSVVPLPSPWAAGAFATSAISARSCSAISWFLNASMSAASLDGTDPSAACAERDRLEQMRFLPAEVRCGGVNGPPAGALATTSSGIVGFDIRASYLIKMGLTIGTSHAWAVSIQ